MDYSIEDLKKYSKLWDDVVMEANPKLWERGVELMKEIPLWEETANQDEFLTATDDEIAHKVKSILCDQNGQEILDKMKAESKAKGDFKQYRAWNLLEKWLGEFWDFVKSWVSQRSFTGTKFSNQEIKAISLEDIVNKTILDFVAAQEKASSPKCLICTSYQHIRMAYDDLHRQAKAGDAEAADQLVSAVFNPNKFKQFGLDHPNALIVPVAAKERTGHNQLPIQFAKHVARASGLKVSDTIYQSVKANHTGASKLDRFLSIPKFDGEVEPDREYIILDDHATQGGTLNALRTYIQRKGGYVVGMATIDSSAGGTNLEATQKQLQALRKLDPDGELEDAIKEHYGYPRGFEDLTSNQARFLTTKGNAEEVMEHFNSEKPTLHL